MYNIALKIAYDGTDFLGWQKTQLGPSIQEALQMCLEQILQESVTLQAASRTDRGVHADGQVVNFITSKRLSLKTIQKGLNALLPSSIRILSAHDMPPDFHPTLHTLKKEYHYLVSFDTILLPKENRFFWHVPYSLNLEEMRLACRHLEGLHDFSSFCNTRKNLNYEDKCRQIEKIELDVLAEKRLRFIIIGNNFLYKMVRTLVGTLIYVGRGKLQPLDMPSILKKRVRASAGMTAPALGLTLKEVYYPCLD